MDEWDTDVSFRSNDPNSSQNLLKGNRIFHKRNHLVSIEEHQHSLLSLFRHWNPNSGFHFVQKLVSCPSNSKVLIKFCYVIINIHESNFVSVRHLPPLLALLFQKLFEVLLPYPKFCDKIGRLPLVAFQFSPMKKYRKFFYLL